MNYWTFNFGVIFLGVQIYTEQMDTEGLGRKVLLTPHWRPPENTPKEQTVATATASHEMLTLQALSSSLNTGTAQCRERLPGPRKGFWVTSSSLSPKTAASIYTFLTERHFSALGWRFQSTDCIRLSLEPRGTKSTAMQIGGEQQHKWEVYCDTFLTFLTFF